jgi:hypothetical protein
VPVHSASALTRCLCESSSCLLPSLPLPSRTFRIPIAEALIAVRSGGRIIAAGTPEDVAETKASYTGQYLRELLGRRAGGPNIGRQGPQAGRGVSGRL